MNFEDIERINSEINKLPYLSELTDDWRPIDIFGGDCDSYATRKYLELHKAGLPLADMRLATCKTEKNSDHCVLLVDYDGDTYVLDNRIPQPTIYLKVPYKWVKLQIAGTKDWELA